MAKKVEVVRLSRNERLRESMRQPTSMSLPLAVHHRLDLLAGAAEDIGATRAELVGMLITQASLEPGELESAVLRYRKLLVGDVIPVDQPRPSSFPEPSEDNVVSISRRGPGRPAKHETNS